MRQLSQLRLPRNWLPSELATIVLCFEPCNIFCAPALSVLMGSMILYKLIEGRMCTALRRKRQQHVVQETHNMEDVYRYQLLLLFCILFTSSPLFNFFSFQEFSLLLLQNLFNFFSFLQFRLLLQPPSCNLFLFTSLKRSVSPQYIVSIYTSSFSSSASRTIFTAHSLFNISISLS